MWTYNYSQQDNELMHYGVLGMKWGHRKAVKYENKARIARQSAKEWKEIGANKASKLTAKGKIEKAKKVEAKYAKYANEDISDAQKYKTKSKELTNKHTKLAGGKETYERVTSQKTGKLFVKSMLYGTYGALKYEQARTRGESKGKSFVNGILYGSLDDATGNLLRFIEPRRR